MGSTDRCNTLSEGLRGRPLEQCLSGPFVELLGDGAELCLAVQGQVYCQLHQRRLSSPKGSRYGWMRNGGHVMACLSLEGI